MKTIDNFAKEYYSSTNIPATPLPEGKRNHGGFFIFPIFIGVIS
jgi:hypothetical protein